LFRQFLTNRPQDESDDGILREVALGIERAMDKCISRYGDLVWAIAQRYVRNRSEAEDVVQETFTDVWRTAKRYDPAIATECTFIGMLARRRAIDFARRENRRPQLEPLPEAESLSRLSAQPSPAIHCGSEDIRMAIKLLSEETQRIFQLHFDEGLTHPEISERTGLPMGTVKTRLRRGLIEVRDKLRHLERAEQPIPSARHE
jgi:RNA polymerase sigma-70 factor (ECF subfamily)